MKYIRVIDDLGDEYLTTYQEHCEMVANLQDSGFDFEGCILKQADTIEELCDEFVIEYPNGDLNTLSHDYSAKLKYMGMEQYNAEINHGWCKLYGAIWTDKGLIFVAKMNEKGELELL